MKYLKQFLLIIAVSMLGELCRKLIPLPVPASIYGMLLLFAGLFSGLIRMQHVRETGLFLIEIMPVMFIPAGVGLLTSWGLLAPILLPVAVITVVTLITVMASTGLVSQALIRRRRKNENTQKEEDIHE